MPRPSSRTHDNTTADPTTSARSRKCLSQQAEYLERVAHELELLDDRRRRLEAGHHPCGADAPPRLPRARLLHRQHACRQHQAREHSLFSSFGTLRQTWNMPAAASALSLHVTLWDPGRLAQLQGWILLMCHEAECSLFFPTNAGRRQGAPKPF